MNTEKGRRKSNPNTVVFSHSGIFINCENIFICDDTNQGFSGSLQALREVHYTEVNSLEVQGNYLYEEGIRLSSAFHYDILRIQSFRGFHPSVDESA